MNNVMKTMTKKITEGFQIKKKYKYKYKYKNNKNIKHRMAVKMNGALS